MPDEYNNGAPMLVKVGNADPRLVELALQQQKDLQLLAYMK
jgi:hypothetical protein